MANQKIPLGLTFDDVLLEPRSSRVHPKMAKLETKLTKKIKLQIPIISAAMDTVTETEMAIVLGKMGGLGVLHRNCSIDEEVKMVKAAKKEKVMVGAAVGPHDFERAKALDRAGADVIFVDCAHGYNLNVVRDAKKIKKNIKKPLVVGNIASTNAAKELVKFADAIKVGVGPGSICTTRVVSGVGVPQLTAIMNVVDVAKKKGVPVIADGGTKYSGDIVKALAAGASVIMLGSMLAGTKESPGEVIKIDGELVKVFRGMGSVGAMKKGMSSDRYFQENNKKYVPEGVEGLVKYKGHLEDVLFQIIGGVRAGMGYIGAATITDIPKRTKFIQITNAGLKESHPHSVKKDKEAPNY
ncbi:MAG: guanosine monophosphate reductase [Candidatus Doudnabacteria bacterium CG10_big_fil_rev_8_21_14_0_10_41_10]|uniref:Guanosine monophosphate reductase n=1 Tax=Candidatus Doudnabacteria bacterium CG10_big_fil_rev_8_21_14_0_10_41_10 TaxID=1974551 RepID=A0A2H0VCG8_9BACT|nr:MAG: guanosine monophosphate reductase [Candidatus Doudnabacteria bacterium CG10_big_fil_rev_8_21_14_0_10_41_10]